MLPSRPRHRREFIAGHPQAERDGVFDGMLMPLRQYSDKRQRQIRNEAATTIEPGAPEAVVQIRTARHVWIPPLVYGGFWLALAILQLKLGLPLIGKFWLVLGCVLLGEAVWLRRLGVDLTPESAHLRGLRRRNIAWCDVQAVVRSRRQGMWVVELVLANGKAKRLRAPTMLWVFGAAQYERDFDRISQWWLANCGDAWQPVRAEAPDPPAKW
jgi:hypothetical protein